MKNNLAILIRKHGLKNAIDHDGKALVEPVIAKILRENPELKTKIKKIKEMTKKVIEEINKFSFEEQKNQLKKIAPELLKPRKVKEKLELPPLPDAKIGKVITAFPPEPSKYPHIGHAKSAFLNYLYAKKYKGKFVVRFEDTNPKLVKKEYYGAILNGLKWLGIRWNKLEYLSNFLENFYKVTQKLLEKEEAYVCLCPQARIKENRKVMKECKCRAFSIDKNLELWKKMFTIFKEGEATVRLKIDMKHSNTTMRDPSIMRIVDFPHPKTGKKYRVWPMYDFGTALMDGWEGITHRVRSKEFEIRKELQQHIQKLLGLTSPYILEIGRLNLEGVPTSGRKIREMIKNKELTGWDDPRLTTLIALKKRGFVPESIKNFLLRTGVSKTDAVVTWEILYAENRKIIDPLANRFFAVLDPVEISVKNAPEIKETKAPLHPDFPKRGYRKIPVNTKKIYIEKRDFEKFKNKEVGLINLFTTKLKREAEFVSEKVKFEVPKIQWVSEPNVEIKIIMPNGLVREGIAEPKIKNVKENDLIQLVRIGFLRCDKVNREIVFYFAHK